MSLNSFLVTDLRPEVELMHLLCMRRHCCHVWNRRHGQTASSLERYLVNLIFSCLWYQDFHSLWVYWLLFHDVRGHGNQVRWGTIVCDWQRK